MNASVMGSSSSLLRNCIDSQENPCHAGTGYRAGPVESYVGRHRHARLVILDHSLLRRRAISLERPSASAKTSGLNRRT